MILAIVRDARQLEPIQELAARLDAQLLTLCLEGRPTLGGRTVKAREADDWSRFDPSEARFAALIARLDALTAASGPQDTTYRT